MTGFSEPANDERPHANVNNMNMIVGTDPVKRKRPFLPKVRTGCTTCKIRKVKCDEAKPECYRCLSTGRKCDGYQHPSNTKSPGNDSLTSLHPGTNAFTSRPERRSFDFFRAVAGQGLGAYFNRPFWTQEVLRAATHYPSIRHLVIALGSAYENFENEETASADDQAIGRHFTLQQANQAIRLMRDHFQSAMAQGPMSAENTSCIMTASILFTYIASLQGHFAQAIEHVRSGLKVLQDFEAVSSSIHTSSAASTATYPVALRDLRRALISLYGQIRCMINDEAKTQWTRDLLVSDLGIVTGFCSLSDAHSHVERLFLNMLTFLQNSEVNPPKTPEEHDAFHKRRREILRALSSCNKAVDLLADSTRHQIAPDGREIKEDDLSGILILRVYLTIIEMRMGMNALRPQDREARFDTLQPCLEQILKYCEAVVSANKNNTSRTPLAAASSHSGLGIVMPLHTVAARCRNFETRKRALDLLFTCSRREGMWDGLMTGKIAANTYMLERQAAMDAAGMATATDGTIAVPDDCRVREVKITYSGDRKVSAEYITVGNWKRGQRGVEKMIQW